MDTLTLNELFLTQLQFNRELVGELSRYNCHVRGLHSIVIGRLASGKLLRIYVAEPGSALHLGLAEVNHGVDETNHQGRLSNGLVPRPTFELGLHAHHCALTLKMLKGQLLHWTFVTINQSMMWEWPKSNTIELLGYKYHSRLRGEEPHFTRQGTGAFRLDDYRVLSANSYGYRAAIHLPADAYHTVHVPKGEQYVAWLVEEGAEDPDYEALTYSNRSLLKYDFSRLYQPMSYLDALALLSKAGLI